WCDATSWQVVSGAQRVNVACTAPGGAPVESAFTLAYVFQDFTNYTYGYARADRPTVASYQASPATSYDPYGAVFVSRDSTGHYRVKFPGLGVNAGTVLVTATSPSLVACAPTSWGDS